MIHYVIVGLGFGDEGKGSAVDWLCSEQPIEAVIRYNGGPQAAHNVVLADGREHTFAQFGSGAFRGVPTHLSQFMLVNPLNMAVEAEHLMSLGVPDPFKTTTISEDALLITRYHIAANRQRETNRGRSRHGSCGQGVGEARSYALKHPGSALRVGDLRDDAALVEGLYIYREYISKLDIGVQYKELPSLNDVVEELLSVYDRLDIVPSDYVEKLLDNGPCVFEGAQGVLLDEAVGFHPHTTWTATTTKNAETLLSDREFIKIGLIRSYYTRHGAGPFPSEEKYYPGRYPQEKHNALDEWQGEWRVGDFDLSLLDYAIRATGGVDELMVTHADLYAPDGTVWYETTRGYYTPEAWEGLDVLNADWRKIPVPENREQQIEVAEKMWTESQGYNMVGTVEDLCDDIEAELEIRPTIISYGPTAEDKKRVKIPLTHV